MDFSSHSFSRFTVNGVEYDSIEDVPEPFRDVIEQAMRTGEAQVASYSTRQFIVDGEPVSAEEFERAYPGRINELLADEDGDGVPDLFQLVSEPQPSERSSSDAIAPDDFVTYPTGFEPERSGFRMSGAAVVGLIVVAVVVGFVIAQLL